MAGKKFGTSGDEEMTWAQWTWLHVSRRVFTVQRSVCELTGEVWIP